MKKVILAPNKSYSGISAGVQFSNGVGETADPHLIQWFTENGYEAEAPIEKSSDELTGPSLEPSTSSEETQTDGDAVKGGIDEQLADKDSAARKAKSK